MGPRVRSYDYKIDNQPRAWDVRLLNTLMDILMLEHVFFIDSSVHCMNISPILKYYSTGYIAYLDCTVIIKDF